MDNPVLPIIQLEEFVVQTQANDDNMLIYFRGSLESAPSLKNLERFTGELIQAMNELGFQSIEIDFSMLKYVSSDGLQGLLQFIQKLLQLDLIKKQALILSYETRYQWQKTLFPTIHSVIPGTEKQIKALPSQMAYSSFVEHEPSILLAGLSDGLYDELSNLLLLNGAKVGSRNSTEEVGQILKKQNLQGVVLDPSRIKGLSTEDPIPWLNSLHLKSPPYFFILTKYQSETRPSDKLKQLEFINNHGSDAFIADNIYQTIIKSSVFGNKRRQHVRVPIDVSENISLTIYSDELLNPIQARIINISMGGAFIEVAAEEESKELKLNHFYEKSELRVNRKMIKTHVIPMVIKNQYIGVRLRNITEGDKKLLSYFILKQMNKIFVGE